MDTRILRHFTFATIFIAIAMLTSSVGKADADVLFDGPEFQVNTYTTYGHGDGHADSALSVSSSPDGRFVVVWDVRNYRDGSEAGVFGQRFDALGNGSGEFQVNTSITGDQKKATVTALSDGGYVVIWESPDDDKKGVFGQRYDSNGAAIGDEFQVNTIRQDGDRPCRAFSSCSGGVASIMPGASRSHLMPDGRGARRSTVCSSPGVAI